MASIRHNHVSHLNLRETTDIYVTTITKLFASITKYIAVSRQRANAREQLANMSPKMLDDIGITPMEAYKEANKPFWRT